MKIGPLIQLALLNRVLAKKHAHQLRLLTTQTIRLRGVQIVKEGILLQILPTCE